MIWNVEQGRFEPYLRLIPLQNLARSLEGPKSLFCVACRNLTQFHCFRVLANFCCFARFVLLHADCQGLHIYKKIFKIKKGYSKDLKLGKIFYNVLIKSYIKGL